MRRRTQLEDEEAALSGFVEGLAPFVKPCALIGGALILASLLGPQERHEETLSMFEGGVGTQRGLHLAHFHAAVLENETSALANASVGVCGSDCARRETASVVANASALGYDGALDSACPAMTAALGSRTTLRLSGTALGTRSSWSMTCSAGGGASAAGGAKAGGDGLGGARLPPSARGSQRLRVYVYDTMDGAHRELLASAAAQNFFDPWHPHNQFLSEFAFHRSLLASPFVTRNAEDASFFFVPFYSRILRSANRSTQRRAQRALAAGLAASPHWQRSAGRDHLLLVSSARPMDELYGEALPYVRDAIQLKIELGDTRRRESLRRANHVAVPYFVPWLAQDDATRAADKTQSVCLAGWSPAAAAGLRASLARAFRDFPNADVRELAAKDKRLGSEDAPTRAAMCGVRQRMRRCKFCLVPRGVTPSARRFYEAIATKCVPVVLSDRFVLPYVASGGGAGLLSAAAVRSFSLHVPEGKPENAPRVVRQAMENHAQMMANLDAHRAAFLYELPADGQPAAGGAVCAILMDVHQRFGPHVRAWRNASSHGGASELAHVHNERAALRAASGRERHGEGAARAGARRCA